MNKPSLRHILPLLFVAILMAACGKGNGKVAVTEDAAEIQFDTLSHDYGTLQPDTFTTYDFVFHNIGATPLYLESVGVSCGCTSTKWPHSGIEPGDAATISVTYDSYGRRPGHFQKSVKVYSNAKTSFVRLVITGDIAEKQEPKKD